MIRALLVCLALYGTARAEAPICPANTNEAWSQWMVDHPHACSCVSADGNGGTMWNGATCPEIHSSGFSSPDIRWENPPEGGDVISRLDRIEATLKALCEHSGATCPKEMKP